MAEPPFGTAPVYCITYAAVNSCPEIIINDRCKVSQGLRGNLEGDMQCSHLLVGVYPGPTARGLDPWGRALHLGLRTGASGMISAPL